MQGIHDFREHLGGQLTITLLKDLGIGHEVHEIDVKMMADSINWLKQRCV